MKRTRLQNKSMRLLSLYSKNPDHTLDHSLVDAMLLIITFTS